MSATHTMDQLDAMKTSELIIKISVLSRSGMKYKEMEGRIEAMSDTQAELCARLAKGAEACTKDLKMACHALDCRIPVPRD